MGGPKVKELSLFNAAILKEAAWASVLKLTPWHLWRNPVMFVVEVGSVLTTALWVRDILSPSSTAAPLWFTGSVCIWLWITVLFANFAEAVAEGRG
ncbi:MAG TPA: hypothetical protein VND64_20245, partial [Pirellulales bacterium]|nr:hypothetical protein [Pirellulales bacterium]